MHVTFVLARYDHKRMVIAGTAMAEHCKGTTPSGGPRVVAEKDGVAQVVRLDAVSAQPLRTVAPE